MATKEAREGKSKSPTARSPARNTAVIVIFSATSSRSLRSFYALALMAAVANANLCRTQISMPQTLARPKI
jgi:hypothetical protein